MTSEQTKLVNAFLRKNLICTVSTVSPVGQPESASMAFTEKKNLEIIFQTSIDTRKYKNLQSDPRVAIVVGWNLEEMVTVQYQGNAYEVLVGELEETRFLHVTKNERSKEYMYLTNNKYFVVKPTWIRYSDLINNIIFEEKYG